MDRDVYSTSLDSQRWLEVFKKEYRRRTGITWNEDAGRTDEEALKYYFPKTCPFDAVHDQIVKYDLVELD